MAQSYYRFSDKRRYPLYASQLCWESLIRSLPHLEKIIEFKCLDYGFSRIPDEIPDVELTAYPVYHGTSACGAVMIVAEVNNRFPYSRTNHWSLKNPCWFTTAAGRMKNIMASH